MQTKIFYEDKDIIVVHKPAGIAVQTARIGQADVVSELKNYLAKGGSRQTDARGSVRKSGSRYAAGSNQQVYLGIIHRLDQPVEGVLVFAKNQRAAAALSKQLTEDDFCKEYIAVVCGQTPDGRQELVDYLAKEDGRAVMYETSVKIGTLRQAAVSDREADIQEKSNDKVIVPKKAILHYEKLCMKNTSYGMISLLQVQLQTGRFHQIRAQLAHAGTPILGDAKYGSIESMDISQKLGVRNTALCACRLTFAHPVTMQKMEYTVTPVNRAFALLEE